MSSERPGVAHWSHSTAAGVVKHEHALLANVKPSLTVNGVLGSVARCIT